MSPILLLLHTPIIGVASILPSRDPTAEITKGHLHQLGPLHTQPMASRSFPPRSENSKSQRNDCADKILDQPGEMRKSIRALASAQIVIAIGVTLGICYFAKLVLVTIVFLLLIAFVLDPLCVRSAAHPNPTGGGIGDCNPV